MLEETGMARTAIQQKNLQRAKTDVDRALNDANQATAQHSGTDLVPLYTELERISVIEPIMKRRQANTKNSTSTGSADRSASGSQQGGALAVHEVVGGATSAFLDVTAAQRHLQAAQQALNKNDSTQANRELQAVEDSVVIESVATDMPLLRARENLVLARDSAEAGKYQRSQAELRAASRALSEYEKTSTSHSQDAQHLRTEIDTYAQSLAKNHTDANSKIESWWDQTTNWITPANAGNRSTANNGTGSQSGRH